MLNKKTKKSSLVNFRIDGEESEINISEALNLLKNGHEVKAVCWIDYYGLPRKVITAPLKEIQLFKTNVKMLTEQVTYEVAVNA